jgi:predicted enzyme related to lactoylglutathione lyase
LHPNEIFSGTVNTLAVPDIGTYIEKIKQHSGVIEAEKHAIPRIG